MGLVQSNQSNSGQGLVTSGSIPCIFNFPNTQGNCLIVCAASEGFQGSYGALIGLSCQDTVGNLYYPVTTRLSSVIGFGDFAASIFVAPNCKASSTAKHVPNNKVTVMTKWQNPLTIYGPSMSAQIFEWSGLQSSSVIDQFNSGSGITVNTNSGSITTLHPNELVFVYAYNVSPYTDTVLGFKETGLTIGLATPTPSFGSLFQLSGYMGLSQTATLSYTAQVTNHPTSTASLTLITSLKMAPQEKATSSGIILG